MKKILSFILCIAMLAGVFTAFANETPITIKVNGVTVQCDAPPFIENGRTLVPLRAITEAMGCKVNYFADTQIIQIQNQIMGIGLKIGDANISKIIRADKNANETIVMDVAPKIVSDRTFVPARAITQAFGAEVGWDNDTRTVTIDLPFTNIDPLDANGLGKALKNTENGTKYGFIDVWGTQVIPVKYDEVTFDGTNYACISVDEAKWFKLDKNNVIQEEKSYDKIFKENDKFCGVKLADNCIVYINIENGEATGTYAEIKPFKDNVKVSKIVKEGKEGIIDNNTGKIIVPAIYEYVFITDGQYWAIKDEKGIMKGYILNSQDDGYTESPKYSNVMGFNVGYAVVQDTEGEFGYINENGVEVIKCKYNSADKFVIATNPYISKPNEDYFDLDGKGYLERICFTYPENVKKPDDDDFKKLAKVTKDGIEYYIDVAENKFVGTEVIEDGNGKITEYKISTTT